MSSQQETLRLGTSLDEIVEDLVDQIEADEERGKPYRKVDRQRERKTRRSFPQAMSVPVQRAVMEVIGRGRHPYSHQFDAWDALLNGNSLVLTTPTASGKTLAFNPVVLDAVARRDATALYVFPLVDLATSQQDALEALTRALRESGGVRAPRISAIHSSAEGDWSERMRGAHDFVLTTPESLHGTLLPSNYPNWRRFFRNLRYVVLDEAHVYSGIFGTNMAFLLRRLAHRCLREGGTAPRFIICSATIKNPKSFAKRLLPPLDHPITLISQQSARVPARHELAVLATRKVLTDLFIRLVDARITSEGGGETRGVRTILFINSRSGVSAFVNNVREMLRREGREDLNTKFTGYMAGQANARQTFRSLMEGELSSIVTTNKLMAGIDIGDLDVSIVYRFQRRFLDMRQMFGRAGRRDTGAWIFVGSPQSLADQYVVDSFPEVFECREPESSIVDLSNERLQRAHLRCLNGFFPEKFYRQEGPADPRLVRQLFGEDVQIPESTNGDNPWRSPPLDSTRLQLRGADIAETYKLVLDGKEESGEEAQQVPQNLAFRDHHPGAILDLDGQIYRVDRLDHADLKIRASYIGDTNVRTRCNEDVEARLLEKAGEAKRFGIVQVSGMYNIRLNFNRYETLRQEDQWICPRRGCEILGSQGQTCRLHRRKFRYMQSWKVDGEKKIDPPLRIEMDTFGVEMAFNEALQALEGKAKESDRNIASRREPDDSRALIEGLRALVVNSYEDAFLGDGYILGAIIGRDQRLLFFDSFPGGIGIAKALYDDEEGVIWRSALRRVRNCRCVAAHGCVKCVRSPRTDKDQVCSKAHVETLISILLEQRSSADLQV